jgi:hypothetical protein
MSGKGFGILMLLGAVLSSGSAFGATPFRFQCDGTSFEVPMVISSKDGLHAKVAASFDILDDIATVDYDNLVVGESNGIFGVDLPRVPGVNGAFSLRMNANLQGTVAMTSTDGDAIPYTGQITCRRTR